MTHEVALKRRREIRNTPADPVRLEPGKIPRGELVLQKAHEIPVGRPERRQDVGSVHRRAPVVEVVVLHHVGSIIRSLRGVEEIARVAGEAAVADDGGGALALVVAVGGERVLGFDCGADEGKVGLGEEFEEESVKGGFVFDGFVDEEGGFVCDVRDYDGREGPDVVAAEAEGGEGVDELAVDGRAQREHLLASPRAFEEAAVGEVEDAGVGDGLEAGDPAGGAVGQGGVALEERFQVPRAVPLPFVAGGLEEGFGEEGVLGPVLGD